MKELLETIICGLVTKKDEIKISEMENEKGVTVYEVHVAEGDMGKIIGKQGVMAKSIRTIMKAIASKTDKKVAIEFVD